MASFPYYCAMELGDRLQHALGSGYAIERELGGGGMSRVFLVTELDLDRKIVVKVLPPDLAAGLSVERFKREIQLAAKLQHPHIVPLLIAGAKDGLLYYAMPYISGEALRSRLAKQHELPVSESLRILRDVADALAYAHANGVVHRDIKPDNVLISGHHALVTDFGVSKALTSSTGDSSITSVGIALGTPAYMSPEQASADPSVDYRADIYSLGALAYELLTGQPPFSGLSPQQMLAAHISRTPDPVSMHRESVPAALEHVVMRCLEKKRADRWQSADELLVQLEALTTPSSGLTPANLVPRSTSSPLVWRVAAAGAALIALIAAARWWMTRMPAPYAVTSTAQITNSPGLELDAAISPDGKLVAYAAGPAGRARVVVRQISGGTARLLADAAPEPQRTPRWSPDGQQISFVVGQSLYAAPAFGGSARRLMDASGYEFASPTLSPDGATIAFARLDGIYLRPVAGGEPRKIGAARWPSYLVWAPDGRRVAYVSDNPWFVYSGAMLGNIANSSIWTVNVGTGNAIRVSDATHLNASPTWTPDGRALLYVSGAGGGRDIYQQVLSRSGEPRGQPVRLTTGVNAHTISLSADGSRLAYTVLTARSNPWFAPISSSGVTPFAAARGITNENQIVEGVAVSPDGQWLAFDSNRGSGHQHIYKIPVTGGEPVQLTRDSADAFDPMWSRDGRMITYHGWKTGNRDVYVMTADGNDVRDVTRYPGHEMGPAWSPDGNKIIFIGDRSGRWEMHVVERARDGSWSDAHQVTEDFGSGGRWTPDGGALVYIGLVDTTFHIANADGSQPRLLFDGHALGLRPQNIAFGARPDVLYFLAIERDGRRAFYSLPLRGGTPRLLFRFDDPTRQPRRPEFDTDGKRLFFTLATAESDVWVMELTKK